MPSQWLSLTDEEARYINAVRTGKVLPAMGATRRFTPPEIPEVIPFSFTVNSGLTNPTSGTVTDPDADLFNIVLSDPYYCFGVQLSVDLPEIYTSIRARLRVLHPKAPAGLVVSGTNTTLASAQKLIIAQLTGSYGFFYMSSFGTNYLQEFFRFSPYGVYFDRGDALRAHENIVAKVSKDNGGSAKLPQYSVTYYMVQAVKR